MAKKFRWSKDNGTTWNVVSADLPYNIAGVAATDVVIVEPIGSAVSIAAVLGPTTASFTAGVVPGTLIANITGLGSGETITDVTPNDGRLAIGGAGTSLVVGLSASSAGSIAAALTTSAGRVLTMAITVNSQLSTDRYMLASNRLGMATDWGVTDAGFASGGAMSGINGGNAGTLIGKFWGRRYRFQTGAWAPKQGRFLWANAAVGVSGVYLGLFDTIIEKVEIRTTAGVLVDTLKFNGATSYTLAAGTSFLSDPCADLSADTAYFIDVYWTSATSAAWPAMPGYYLPGDCSVSSTTTSRATASVLNSTAGGFTASAVGGYFGPSGFFAKGWNGTSPCVLILGDSIADYTRSCADFASARGDRGFIGMALGDPSGGIMTWMSCARYSSYSGGLFVDGASGSTSAKSLLDWLAGALAPLGSSAPFTAVIDEHGRNNMGTGLSVQKGYLASTLAKIREKWGSSVKYCKTTTTPSTTVSDSTFWTNEASQVASGNNAAGSVIQQWNDWLIAGADGQIAACFDVAAVVRSTNDYGKWATRPFTSTLLDAVAANAVSTIRLADAPPVGETLVFEPGSSANGEVGSGYCVYSVASNAGGGYDVVIHKDDRLSNAGSSTSAALKIAKAHAAGTAVRAVVCIDGLHPSNWAQAPMRDVIIAGKAALAP